MNCTGYFVCIAPDQCLLFDDALAVFTLRVNVRVVIKYRDPEVIA